MYLYVDTNGTSPQVFSRALFHDDAAVSFLCLMFYVRVLDACLYFHISIDRLWAVGMAFGRKNYIKKNFERNQMNFEFKLIPSGFHVDIGGCCLLVILNVRNI